MPKTKPTTVDQYIKAAPREAQDKLREIRAILKKVALNAAEAIKWGYPVFEEGRMRLPVVSRRSRRPTPI